MCIRKLFKSKKNTVTRITVEEIKEKYNIDITYPITHITSIEYDENILNEIRTVGCIDIMWDRHWLHQDCRASDSACKKCTFYPHREKYTKINNSTGIADLDKANSFMPKIN